MLPQFENALENLEREVINIRMNPELRERILEEFQTLRTLMEKTPTNDSLTRKKKTNRWRNGYCTEIGRPGNLVSEEIYLSSRDSNSRGRVQPQTILIHFNRARGKRMHYIADMK